MAPPPSELNKLTAEAHRLYALLVPQTQGGKVQIIVPEAERVRMQAQYTQVCARLTELQAQEKANRVQADEWMNDVKEAIPSMLPMLPPQWRPRMEKLMAMSAGTERDDELRLVLKELVNGEAIKRLGPMGLMMAPMLNKFLRNKK